LLRPFPKSNSVPSISLAIRASLNNLRRAVFWGADKTIHIDRKSVLLMMWHSESEPVAISPIDPKRTSSLDRRVQYQTADFST
jgi:hypothetical protein